MLNINEFQAISVKMASPDRIREWSHGEVKKPETINYRTLKPELEGLFCERIFGSLKDWECYCGKFKSIRYRGVVCDRCQVEVTHSKVRRERMGHIELVSPVSHIWYFKATPSKLGTLLNMPVKDLDTVLYYQKYVVINPGNTKASKGDVLTEEQYRDIMAAPGLGGFEADMGASAILKLLEGIGPEDPDKLRDKQKKEGLEGLRNELRNRLCLERDEESGIKVEGKSKQERKSLLKRLAVVEAFLSSTQDPKHMILTVLPVIPPDLRPMVQLDGGRFAASDLNDLYRRVLNRNNRLRRLVDLAAPSIIVRNEKRMLQEAVDALLDNGRRGRPVKGANNNRVLKSLSDMLKGKQGRFRQNLLGKRVDYSGRSVIVVGPELKLNQCGLPKRMALELFKPFIMRVLVNRGMATNIKQAKKMVERADDKVWEVIEDVIADHPVMLNRAPTLHRLGIQAFQPILVEGKAIRVHPLVCVAFNADFDGDQMAVHVPLSAEAIVECKTLMMADRNILSPASGRPIITPTQDIVLGIYYLTKDRESKSQRGRVFSDVDECLYAYFTGVLDLQGPIRVRIEEKLETGPRRSIVETTPGRLILWQEMPAGLEFKAVNQTLGKKQLGLLIDEIYRKFGEATTAATADRIKRLGFTYSTKAGVSIGIDDMKVPNQKGLLVSESKEEVDKVRKQYENGVITDQERYTQIIDLWSNTTDEVAKVMSEEIKADREGFNPIHIMADSGARGSAQQIKQLAGMRGLMADSFGKLRETPITSNFREGLSVIEFFQSTTGSRKGLTDTALKTANAGYLTRRLVDVAQDVVVTEEDCGTTEGLTFRADEPGADPLSQRILGRFLAEEIEDPRKDQEDEDEGRAKKKKSAGNLLDAGVFIDDAASRLIRDSDVKEVKVRSVLTCASLKGVCRKCYGRDLATGRVAEIGEAVGVIAAQSIGEPGTQLTLRTFHTGGAASADDTYIRSRFTAEVTSIPPTKKQIDGMEYVTEEMHFRGKPIEKFDYLPKQEVRRESAEGGRQSQPIRTAGLAVRVMVKDGAVVKAKGEVVRIDLAISDACRVKVIKKDAIVISVTGKKDRSVEIPPGLEAVVARDAKIGAGEPLASRIFSAQHDSKVAIAKNREGGETITLTAVNEMNISAVIDGGKPVESVAVKGTEPKVAVGDIVRFKEIVGMKPSFRPSFAPLRGWVEFEDVALQKDGNDQVVIRPSENENAKYGRMTIWHGDQFVVGPDDQLLVRHGEKVEAGKNVSTKHVSHVMGVVHILRRYTLKDDDSKCVAVVRVVDKSDRQFLSYLQYTSSSPSSSKGSKAMSKVKKQNIRLVAKSLMVRPKLFQAAAEMSVSLAELATRIKAEEVETGVGSDLFSSRAFAVKKESDLQKVYDQETQILGSYQKKDAAHVVEKDDLVIKFFSDFLQAPGEGATRKSGLAKDITGGLPRVEELFEIRKPKSTPAIIAPVDGVVSIRKGEETKAEPQAAGKKSKAKKAAEARQAQTSSTNRIVIRGVDGVDHPPIELPPDLHAIVKNGAEVKAGDLLTDGPVDVHELLRVCSSEATVQQYIVNEVQDVYRSQGVDINDKHIEVIVRQMMRKVLILDPGDTDFLPDELVDKLRLNGENEKAVAKGKTPATSAPLLLGITKAAKHSDSFISAASFQETTWALTQAALQGKKDELRGLKEAVIIGHLIPAGTGMKCYREGIDVELTEPEPVDPPAFSGVTVPGPLTPSGA